MSKFSKICKGKDLYISFPVFTDGQPTSLGGRDLKVVVTDINGNTYIPELTITGHVVHFTYPGTKHHSLGIYKIRLWENYQKNNQRMLDFPEAFELVSNTAEEVEVLDMEIKVSSASLSSGKIPAVVKAEWDGEGVVIS